MTIQGTVDGPIYNMLFWVFPYDPWYYFGFSCSFLKPGSQLGTLDMSVGCRDPALAVWIRRVMEVWVRAATYSQEAQVCHGDLNFDLFLA